MADLKSRDEQHDEHVSFGQPNPTPQGGTITQPANVGAVQPGQADVRNPLGEETIKVRVRPGVEFFPQATGGAVVREGDEFDMPISMARAASQYVDEITADGTVRPVQNEQVRVSRADIAGRPRHERIGALEEELKALDARKAVVEKSLAAEKDALDKDQRKQGDVQVNPPGVPGGHGNQAVPPRPGERR